MTMKRTAIHFNIEDMKALRRLAKEESQRTGSTITAAAIVRHLIREHLQKHKKLGAVPRKPPARRRAP